MRVCFSGPGTRIPDVPTEPSPKYLTMRERLRRRILELPIGAPISSERDLAQEYGVSRMTARRAVIDLTREGLLDRHVGRGTFVAQPRIELRLSLSSFTDDMRAKGKSRVRLCSSSAGNRPMTRASSRWGHRWLR